MSLGTPVIAVNNGGPLETVKHGETGFLCNEVILLSLLLWLFLFSHLSEQNPSDFMEAMYKIVEDHETKKMGKNGINHVRVS